MIKTFKYMALAAFCAAAAPASAFTAQEQQTLSLARDFMQCMDDYNTQHDARRIPVQERIDRQEAENRRIDRSDLPRYESPRMVCERSLGTDYFDLSDQISTLNRKYGYSSVSQAIGGYFP